MPVIARPEFPRDLTSQMTLRVRFCETDLMGIVHHANYLLYFEAGRVDWLQRRGITYATFQEEGIHLAVVKSSADHHGAVRFDELLVVTTACIEVTWLTVRFIYSITGAGELRCEGETRLVCVGNDLAPRRLPKRIASVLGGRDALSDRNAHKHPGSSCTTRPIR